MVPFAFFFALSSYAASNSSQSFAMWSWNRTKSFQKWEVSLSISIEEKEHDFFEGDATFAIRSKWWNVSLSEAGSVYMFCVFDAKNRSTVVTFPTNITELCVTKPWNHSMIHGVKVNASNRGGGLPSMQLKAYIQQNSTGELAWEHTATVGSNHNFYGNYLKASIVVKNPRDRTTHAVVYTDPTITINGQKVAVEAAASSPDVIRLDGEKNGVRMVVHRYASKSAKMNGTTMIVVIVACLCGGILVVFLLVVCFASRYVKTPRRRRSSKNAFRSSIHSIGSNDASEERCQMRAYYALQRANTRTIESTPAPLTRKVQDLNALRKPKPKSHARNSRP